ncbi:ABC transporter substrate-binding protein [Bifidobacterium merycicum]|uniref:ABC transporter substrate-binding protein n=1 Tax=Bifidobacterium merycicum TaxID=78345 RepID=A0A087BI86_9BIFI|nr:ABC transporter substrate-binding protein [Bifidobacterium merycicum]KFI70736.1 ABC transporter substrate-binding protein [Bifidobacterium merycicum]MBQ1513137.1 ABC transporter substrate-binding protein [Bifidobacterium sp.]MEE1294913.1 ABC transporter substrate-binding protein [Bifidobacterium merycicum]SHE31111.1 amino acid ABC transporter substrate-binding protein, PAAT family [Bifidobacterium merycicum DSM 6492]
MALKTTKKLRALTAAALSAAMLVSFAACGTSDATDKDSGASKTTTAGYDVSSVKKDAELATLVEGNTVKDGELSVGMELSYAPAEFLAEDGKTPTGYDVDISKAIGNVLGLKTKIVSSMFDTIVPSVGSKYDLGITAMTITKERMDSVDFVSYYRAGSTWTVQKGNPKKVDTSDLCGNKIAVQTGTVQEDEANKIAKQCETDGKKDAEVASYKRQAEAATAVATDKADVFYADSPVAGYAISQTDGQLEALGKDVGVVKEGIAIQKNNTKMATAVQKAVQKLMDDGTYMKILKHWGVESGALDKAEINPTDLD